jgi:DNA topoisomerase-3
VRGKDGKISFEFEERKAKPGAKGKAAPGADETEGGDGVAVATKPAVKKAAAKKAPAKAAAKTAAKTAAKSTTRTVAAKKAPAKRAASTAK